MKHILSLSLALLLGAAAAHAADPTCKESRKGGHQGVEEVQIDAVSGQVISVAHETPATEAAERD